MANNQMIGTECPTRCKRARMECLATTQSCLGSDRLGSQNTCIYDTFVSSSSDAEIMSCSDSGFDSGFQEFISNMSNKDNDSNNFDNNYEINKSNIYSNHLCHTNEEPVDKTHKSVDGSEEELLGNGSTDAVQQSGDYECDDGASDVSDLSCVSCLSDMSGQQWKPVAGPVAWVHKQMCSGTDPRIILTEMVADNTLIPDHLDNYTLWRIIVNMLSEPPPRRKLLDVNTLDDVIHLINKCQRILVLTGAGVSVSCGIPDFRSRDGIYARLSKDFPDLPDPQAMFDIHYFRKDPRPFFKFAKEIYPGQFEPSISHKFIKILEEKNKLLRNYTQNIDTLEKAAGIDRVITCHGSFATATCTQCKLKVDASFIKKDIFEQKIPKCPHCPEDSEEMAVIKPDIVFFGEGLSDEFHSAMSRDKDECDLLIVMGSSLKVRPVALIPSSIPETVPQILINREPLNHLTFDVELLGDCDVIVRQLCDRLGTEWNQFCPDFDRLDNESTKSESKKCENICLEVNNNSTQMNSSLPFAFNTTVNELRVSDHNPCHTNDKPLHNTTDALNPDSSESESPKPSDDRIASQLSDDKYLYFPPSRYIFKGAEVFDSDLSTHKKSNGEISDDDNSNSSLSASSLSTTPCSSSSSSSSLSTTDSLLSPIHSNSCNTSENSVENSINNSLTETKASSPEPSSEPKEDLDFSERELKTKT